jgi:hypothetical protein
MRIGEAVARQGRNHDVERVRRAAAMRGGIGERLDDLQLLDDRARPAVRDDERQCIVMLRSHMNEMNVQPVDLGQELRMGVQPRLRLPPVVLRRPVTGELLHRRQLHALRLIGDGLPVGPAHRRDALPQVVEVRLRGLEAKGADGGSVGVLDSVEFGFVHGRGHASLLLGGIAVDRRHGSGRRQRRQVCRDCRGA